MTIQESIKLYLKDQASRGNSMKTVSDYATKLVIFQEHCKRQNVVQLGEITLSFLQDFVLELRNSGSINSVSVQSYIRSLRAFLNWSYSYGYIDVDLCQRFKLPKAQRDTIDILTDDEINSIYACFPNESNQLHLRNKVIISLMLDCGLRLNEVCELSVRDLHLTERLLIVNGKGAKQRYVTFGDYTFVLLTKYIALVSPRDSLFVKFDDLGTPEGITQTTIKQLFRRLKSASGVKRLYPHLLRHTFATRFLESGGDIYTLQALLGHSSLDMVKKYLHLSQARLLLRYKHFSPLDQLNKPSSRDEGFK